MSDTVTYIGNASIIDVFGHEEVPFNKKVLRLIELGYEIEDWSNEWITSEDVIYADGHFYRINRNRCIEHDENTTTKRLDGSFDFVVNFYNGGCGFDEAFEDIVRNMNKEKL